MLPQTNLQLYKLLMDSGVSEQELAVTRQAHDLARLLFSHCYRPSHKPFIAHLIGAAGALAMWGEPVETVVAGMLHSAYLFGDFGDGRRGPTPRRREVVRNHVGIAAEQLIHGYTLATWKAPLEETAAAVETGQIDRTAVVIKLADLCDECSDAGPRFALGKPLEYGLPGDLRSRKLVLELVQRLVGPAARAHFARQFAQIDACEPPLCLQSADRSFHAVGRLPKSAASPLADRLYRFAARIRQKRAA